MPRELQIDKEARGALERLLQLFEKPDELPAKMAKVFMAVGDRYCSRWSDRNQFIVAIMGASDAATAKTWHGRGRYVTEDRYRNGGFNILKPLTRTFRVEELDADGNTVERSISYLYGFAGWHVFAKEETEVTNQELAAKFEAEDSTQFINALPWLQLAKSWGLEVSPATSAYFDGAYSPDLGTIQLTVQAVRIWAHELIHASEDKLGKLTRRGQDAEQEIVAEMGAQVLLQCAGLEAECDLRSAYEYISHYGGNDALKKAYDLTGRIVDAVGNVLRSAQEVANA